MPPKPKKALKTSKPPASASLPPTLTPKEPENASTTSSGLDPEAEDQFELELCWCIQKLETCLSSSNSSNNKIADKQVQSITKTIDYLKRDNVPFIKKRQLMRVTLGDYRSKMQQEEKQYGKTVLQFPKSTKTKNTASIFIKKASNLKSNGTDDDRKLKNDSSTNKLLSQDNSEEPFKFNFSVNNK